MDTLRNVYRLVFVVYSLLIFSCSSNSLSSKISKEFIDANFKDYEPVYNLLLDSSNFYVESALKTFGGEYTSNWFLDSMICINSTNDKLVGILISSKGNGSENFIDMATKILGKQIDGKWYFWKGIETFAIVREEFGYSENNAPPVIVLSSLARHYLLTSALVKQQSNYEVNDEWINKIFYTTGYDPTYTKEQSDSLHWHLIMDKWNHKIDTNEYKPLKKFHKDKPTS